MTTEVGKNQDRVEVTVKDGRIAVPHLGITLRVLLAAASQANALNPRRDYKLEYKGAIIGSLRLKDFK